MSDTTTAKKRTITLTDRPPVKIKDEDWPELAAGSWEDFDNQYEFQANRTWDAWVKVRQHQDGRTIVYGGYDYDTAFQGESGARYRAGELLTAPVPVEARTIVDAIHRVTQDLAERSAQGDHFRDVANECIAALPAQEL